MNSRHLLEKHKLSRQLFKKVNRWLSDAGIYLKEGTIVDARTGLTHSLSTTAANVHDITETANLLHGEECFVSADSGYCGAQKREELKRVKADGLIAAFFETMGKQNKDLKKAP